MNAKPKFILQISIASIALLLMLIYTAVHTGGLLASYVEPEWVGYAAAVGIELAVVGLSLQIGQRKHSNKDAGFFYFVLGAVVFVSFLANVSEGYLQRYEAQITKESVLQIDLVQGIIGIAATGLLSLITMAMAEIVGQYMQQETPDEEPMQDEDYWETQKLRVIPEPEKKPTKAQQAIAIHERHNDWTLEKIAEAVPCAVSTVSRAINNNGNR